MLEIHQSHYLQIPIQPANYDAQLIIFLILLSSFVVIAKFFRISALASLFTVIISGYFVITDTNNTSAQIGTLLIILIIIFQHRSNIERLLKGNENKF